MSVSTSQVTLIVKPNDVDWMDAISANFVIGTPNEQLHVESEKLSNWQGRQKLRNIMGTKLTNSLCMNFTLCFCFLFLLRVKPFGAAAPTKVVNFQVIWPQTNRHSNNHTYHTYIHTRAYKYILHTMQCRVRDEHGASRFSLKWGQWVYVGSRNQQIICIRLEYM